jgi:hypothetical protein
MRRSGGAGTRCYKAKLLAARPSLLPKRKERCRCAHGILVEKVVPNRCKAATGDIYAKDIMTLMRITCNEEPFCNKEPF